MLTSVWFVILSRIFCFFQIIGTTLSHLAVMIERIRATLLAHIYEWEGIKFGIIINFFMVNNFMYLFTYYLYCTQIYFVATVKSWGDALPMEERGLISVVRLIFHISLTPFWTIRIIHKYIIVFLISQFIISP